MLGICPEEIFPGKRCFRWPIRTKIQRVHQNLLKEVNSDHKYLQCPYLQENNFEVPRSAILLDKEGLACAETIKVETTINGSSFITYSNTIYFPIIGYTTLVIV